MAKEKIKILYEDKDVLVLDKPAGFVVHGDGKTKQDSISDYILKNFKKIKGVGENTVIRLGDKEVEIQRPGIVHRLDKDTSGCLVVAKNQKAFENLKHQFQEHKVKKEYQAIVWGNVRYDTGIIDAAIARSKNDFRKKEIVKVTSSAKEKFRGEERSALTRYKVDKRFSIFGETLTLITFFPQTGRMHQIRIHAKSIGHPIVGDHLYGPIKKSFETKYFGKVGVRHLLHAKSISFHRPNDGEVVVVESPVPKDFKTL
jgi:23S rRNA pseudouridine1911/1915/1917 synthase